MEEEQSDIRTKIIHVLSSFYIKVILFPEMVSERSAVHTIFPAGSVAWSISSLLFVSYLPLLYFRLPFRIIP